MHGHSVNVLISAPKRGGLRGVGMTGLLEFPDGVRLAQIEEIPGSEAERSAVWEQIKRAQIAPGFTLADSLEDARFRYYAEINVNASKIWEVFRDLCASLLVDPATLIAGEIDDDPLEIACAELS